MTIKKIFSVFSDFLFPKDKEILELESLSLTELISKLTPAKDVDGSIISIWNYADPKVRSLIWELKYRKNEELIKKVAILLLDIIRSELEDRALFESAGWREGNPLLIPIPMSEKRYKERGFNQTRSLCEEIIKLDAENFLEYNPNVLYKSRHTTNQTLIKNKKERMENIKNSMEANKEVQGRNVVLIDDVTTTGATIGDARRALKQSGVRNLLCITLAH